MEYRMGLDLVELVMAIEEAFEITISDAEAGKIQTMGDLCECVSRKITPPETGIAPDPKVLWHKVRDVVVDQFGVDWLDLTPDTRFIEDLGAD